MKVNCCCLPWTRCSFPDLRQFNFFNVKASKDLLIYNNPNNKACLSVLKFRKSARCVQFTYEYNNFISTVILKIESTSDLLDKLTQYLSHSEFRSLKNLPVLSEHSIDLSEPV